MAGEQDWRLEARLEAGPETAERLDRLVEEARAGSEQGTEGAVPAEVAVTHDGRTVFAYASTQEHVDAARRALQAALARDGAAAEVRVSRWDGERMEWFQVEPPLSAEEASALRAREADEDAVETQTFVVNAGRFVSGEVERTMQSVAASLGVECRAVEHRHLLTTQIAFTVTGPRRRLREFRDALVDEASVTIRADGFGTGLV